MINKCVAPPAHCSGLLQEVVLTDEIQYRRVLRAIWEGIIIEYWRSLGKSIKHYRLDLRRMVWSYWLKEQYVAFCCWDARLVAVADMLMLMLLLLLLWWVPSSAAWRRTKRRQSLFPSTLTCRYPAPFLHCCLLRHIHVHAHSRALCFPFIHQDKPDRVVDEKVTTDDRVSTWLQGFNDKEQVHCTCPPAYLGGTLAAAAAL